MSEVSATHITRFTHNSFSNGNGVEYRRQVSQPSYQSAGYYSNTRPTPTSLPSTHHAGPARRNSQWPQFSNKPHTQRPSLSPALSPVLSPALHFNQASNRPLQSSPSLQSTTGESTENHTNPLTLPAFSPSAFSLSPPPFLTNPPPTIAPTPPSNPQYATFPFDTSHAKLSGAAHPGPMDTSTALTPGAQSQTSGSHTGGSETGNLENDPFLSLLEQLAENEHSQGGPSELDFFLTGDLDGEADGEDEGNSGGGT